MTRLTALAQLIDILGRDYGLTATADLVDETGYSERAIRKAKAELDARHPSAETAPGCRKATRHPSAENGTRVPKRHPSAAPDTGTPVPPPGTPVPKTAPGCRLARVEVKQNNLPNPKAKLASFFSFEQVEAKIWEAAGPAMMHDGQSDYWPRKWHEAGADFEADVYPTIRAKVRTVKPESIEHYGWFTQAILEAVEDRKAGRPNRFADHDPEASRLIGARWLAERGIHGVTIGGQAA